MMQSMKLTLSVGASVPSLWIDGPLPWQKKRDWKVKLRGKPKSTTRIPPFSDVGDLLCGERPSPLQHRVTLKLRYQKSNPPPIYDQILIPLTKEALAEIREVDAEECSYELMLDDVELERIGN